MKTLFTHSILLGSALTLTACGGGGSSSVPTPVAPAPPPPPIAADTPSTIAGPISGFGSIIVNGIRYNTDNADFTVNDSQGTQSDLKVGQFVTVKATTDAQGNATAQQVFFDDVVKGPIDSIDVAGNILVILGQTIFIDANTSFDDRITPADINGLSVGDIVEVSGEFNADGDITASRIETKPAGTEFEIHGKIAALDTGAQSFNLSQLSVDYSSAVLDDFNASGLANGDFIEVKGSTFNTGGALIARKVEFEGSKDRIGDDKDNGEIHGFVTEFTSSSSFTVGDVPVITNANTTFERGSAADIALNVRLEAEGSFNSNGELVAKKIKFEDEANVKITATLDSVDTANNTITVFGVSFNTDSSTRFEDKSDEDKTSFNLSDLNAGDYLEIRGRDRASDGLYASKVEREDERNRNIIQAFVETINGESLVILGITINTDNKTQYEDIDDSVLTKTAFFNKLASGDLVKARGAKIDGTTLLAKELSLEAPDD
jgi:hypothetical protein